MLNLEYINIFRYVTHWKTGRSLDLGLNVGRQDQPQNSMRRAACAQCREIIYINQNCPEMGWATLGGETHSFSLTGERLPPTSLLAALLPILKHMQIKTMKALASPLEGVMHRLHEGAQRTPLPSGASLAGS